MLLQQDMNLSEERKQPLREMALMNKRKLLISHWKNSVQVNYESSEKNTQAIVILRVI